VAAVVAVVAVVAAVVTVVATMAAVIAVAAVVAVVEEEVAACSPLDHGRLSSFSTNPWIVKARPFMLGSLYTS
jgi:hypothetical protein